MATRPYFQGRRHFGIYLNERETKEMERALRKRGLSFAAFVRASMEHALAERLPDPSKDGIQRVEIDAQSAQSAADALVDKAEELRRSADRVYVRRRDLEVRTELRSEADDLDGLAAWFLEIVKGADLRIHLVESGKKTLRVRRAYRRESQSV